MMNFKNSLTAFAVAAALGLSSSVMAAETGGLKIKVTDQNGNPIAGATVLVKAPDSLVSKNAVSDAEGFVSLRGLDASNQYTVSINGTQIQAFEANNVRVITGKSLNLSYAVSNASSNMETIVVSGRAVSAIDTTSATTGMDITLDMTESLPTGRSYQSYLQLTPGVKPSSGGNPSSKSGVNYSDAGGAVGTSSDNVYYIDGVNVTDNVTGTFGGNINSEIIQEQQVITGAIPAKYAGGSGLVSRVVTKSGSNEFHGSVNYYFQNDSLVGDYDSPTKSQSGFSTFDTAVTLGGPIIEDELWFFASYQLKNRKDDVADPETGAIARSVENESTLGFGKLTWQATNDDRLVFTYFNDPTDVSGSSAFDTLSNRDRSRKQGGDNYKIDYTHSWDDVVLNAGYMRHESELSDIAKDKSTRNDVAYFADASTTTQSDTDLGGLGSDTLRERNKESYYVNAEYYLDTNDFGYHTIEVGYSAETNENITNSVYTGDSAQYTSIGAADAGTTYDQYANADGWIGNRDLSDDDAARIAAATGIAEADVANIVFNSTAGNPTGDVNVYRIIQTQQAESKLETKGQSFYVQDSINIDDLTLNVGLRAEKWSHYASTGEKIFSFDWDVAHRLSAVYDINGDGDSKVWAFHGRYYDPVRTDMTSFAGNLTGSVREEQVFVDGSWQTFRTRGGVATQDAFFSPTTKTPYTDEFLVGYSTNLTEDTNISVTYTNRKTRDILEDYDLGVYTEGGQLDGSSLALPLSYFGYTENPGSNYVLATLEGGKRDYQGVEVTFKKLRTDNWNLLASYTYNDAEGNTNSDGNADLQGDFYYLDPRAPNMYGKQPGNVDHQFKILGTYYFDNGFEVGAVYNWNSGTAYNRASNVYGRYLPLREETTYDFGGYDGRWIAPGNLASQETPAFGTLDVRLKYVQDFGDYEAEFFLDVFNILDDQAVTEEEQLVAGSGSFEFGEAKDWVAPRRFYLGAKVLF
ncbi:TonB-dependent receptor [Psychrosphaera haliotis]|uniref:TonB-dependent receptor n=1 Tax=Psychrosphaera haliotis TaxID=555083 RepID=A0A6N8FAF8_9GAMM|nr:TonB-dependent receptor [Psychrosphaera haliotis]MUH73443.1 TonB-dependent receptor [Psychrosphaera haliotis]